MVGYLYVLGTLIFTVYGQMILKWRMNSLGQLPEGYINKFQFLIRSVFDPFIFTGFLSAFIASLFWMAAMTKFEITKVYPFMSLAPALVFVLGIVFWGEAFTWGKLIGLVLIIIGLIATVKL